MQRALAGKLAQRLNLRLMALTVLLLVATLGTAGAAALALFDAALAPAIDRKAEAIGRTAARTVERALGYDIPLAAMRGVDAFLAEQAAGHPEVLYIAITNADGETLFAVGEETVAPSDRKTAADLSAEARPTGEGRPFAATHSAGVIDHATALFASRDSDSRVAGSLHVGVDRAYVRKELQDILFDIAVVIFAALLITFEFLLFLVTTTLTGPIQQAGRVIAGLSEGDYRLRAQKPGGDEIGRVLGAVNAVLDEINRRFAALKQRAAAGGAGARKAVEDLRARSRFSADDGEERLTSDRIALIRTPLFIFIFAESLSLSFFPLFVDTLYEPVPGLSREIVIGLPIALFMLIWAVSQPISGFFSDRRGRKLAFLIGAAITVGGLALTAIAADLYQLMAYRCLTAFGYGMAYIACQGYVVDNTTADNRTQGFNVFVVGFFAATICGTAIGAILAERLGYRPTFLFAAALAAAALVFVWRVLDRDRPDAAAAKRLTVAEIRAVFANPRFVALTLFAAIPAKFVLAAYVYFLAPVYLAELGNSQSAVGRVLMAYAVLMVFLSPWTAKLSDRVGRPLLFVVLGTAMSGLALVTIVVSPDTPGVLASVLLLGFGHAVSVSTLATMVPMVTEAECARLGRGTVMGVYRLVERFGSVLGPFVAGALLAVADFPTTIAAIGVGLMLCALFVAGLFAATRRRSVP